MMRCCLLLALVASIGAVDDGRPDVVVIVIDTLRTDHVGRYGYGRDTTPHLDRLASDGVVCTQMIAASSWTLPSMMTLFTSTPPAVHGLTTDSNHCLPPSIPTLAELLHANGYQTRGVTSNPMTNAKFGFGRGFDHYDDFTVPMSCDHDLFADAGRPEGLHANPSAAIVNRVAQQWLPEIVASPAPFLLYVHYLDPHADYAPPPPHDRQFASPDYHGLENGRGIYPRRETIAHPADRQHIIDLYDGEVAYTDARVGELVESLTKVRRERGMLTVIIADHGEEFWDHGGMLHGHALYEELVRVPCILHWSPTLPAGGIVNGQVAHCDVMPTILEACGVALPESMHGRSFLAEARGEARTRPPSDAFIQTEAGNQNQHAIRHWPGKIIRDLRTGRELVFDLAADPTEQHDLSATPPEWHRDLSARLDTWLALIAHEEKNRQPGQMLLDPATVEQLKSLGYFTR